LPRRTDVGGAIGKRVHGQRRPVTSAEHCPQHRELGGDEHQP
jgi:hypothetical protein